jgi:glutamate-1-semialdehyde 2,1-aminomutase
MITPAGNNDLLNALADAEAHYTNNNPKSAAQYERALHSMPGGNTRTVLFYPPFPLTLERGIGCRVWDLDGHEYIDFLSEYTAGLYGHSHAGIRTALDHALDAGIVLGGHNAQEAEFADLVVNRFPFLEQVRFTNSGTEANLMAISSARAFTGRSKVMVMEGGYHGGVLYFAPGGTPINAPFPYLIGRYNDIDGCRDLIQQNADDLACVILEPMLGGGGCIQGSPEFLAMLREQCTTTGALLIFDEVMTSRLGPHGLQGELNIQGDLSTLGKYVGGGMSFGAFGGRGDVMSMYDPRGDHPVPHAGTFNNNMLTMSAGAAGIRDIYTEDIAISFNACGDRLRQNLQTIADDQGAAIQISGRGSMMAVHFTDKPPTQVPDLAAQSPELKRLFHLDMLSRGIYTAARNMIVMSLPMVDADCEALTSAFSEFVSSYRSLLT